MKPINNPVVKQAAQAMQAAMKAGDETKLNEAWEQFHDAVCDSVRNDFEMSHNDDNILMQRGYRVLTADEKQIGRAHV